jgi:cobalt-zinc-cadmium efflux system protein
MRRNDGYRNVLLIVLVLNAGFLVAEATVGFLTHSLVLLADAGHMLVDVAGLSLALGAVWLAQRPANRRKTFGYYRAEIIGAFLNAVLLLGVSAFILFEAVDRLSDPPDVPGFTIMAVGFGGLIVNLTGGLLLHARAKENINARAAFLDALQDILGSAAAITAGLVLVTTGWKYADAILAGGVGLLILPRTWNLMKSAVDVLFEGTPSGINMDDVERQLLSIPGVQAVHDLHIWMVTSGFVVLSGHVRVPEGADRDEILVSIRQELANRFNIEHITIQMENESLEQRLESLCLADNCYESAAVGSNHSPDK